MFSHVPNILKDIWFFGGLFRAKLRSYCSSTRWIRKIFNKLFLLTFSRSKMHHGKEDVFTYASQSPMHVHRYGLKNVYASAKLLGNYGVRFLFEHIRWQYVEVVIPFTTCALSG